MTGDVRADVPIRPRRGRQAEVCAAEGCHRKPVGRNHCSLHRHRLVNYGDPLEHIPPQRNGRPLQRR